MTGLIATAGPASAHTGAFSRTCDSIKVHLTNFHASQRRTNTVHVTLNGKAEQNLVFHGSSVDATFPWAATGTVHAVAQWFGNETSDGVHGSAVQDLAAPSGCKPPCATVDDISYTFNGPAGEASVTVHGENALCTSVTVLLASYKTEGPDFAHAGHQTVFDQMSQVIDKPGTYNLKVQVPNCFYQDDLYVTDKKAQDFDSPNDTLGDFLASKVWPRKGPFSASNGGTTACMEQTPTPTPTPTATSPSTTPTTVAPTSTPPPAGAVTPPTALPNTGASPMPKVLLALVLLGAGTGLAFLGRSRRRRAMG